MFCTLSWVLAIFLFALGFIAKDIINIQFEERYYEI